MTPELHDLYHSASIVLLGIGNVYLGFACNRLARRIKRLERES